MSGIYIHIPFCKKACHYCDFHFSTSLQTRNAMVEAIAKELALQRDFLPDKTIETLYFGGGTPSLLSEQELQLLFDSIDNFFHLSKDAEITLEANPDDLDKTGIQKIRSSPINRLSIGIQSFFEEDLLWMNRSHTAAQASDSVKRAQDAGISNISIDLIYGVPSMTMARWSDNLAKAFELEVPHLSAYCLTVEKNTALADFIRKGTTKALNEEQGREHFNLLMDTAALHGYEQYEISNFSIPGRQSRHNSNYWNNVPYLGLGPSAHSFKPGWRQWNIANNNRYIESIQQGQVPFEWEELSEKQALNEYIMTALRTAKGIDLAKTGNAASELQNPAGPFLEQGLLLSSNNHLYLSKEGKHFADRIAGELFID